MKNKMMRIASILMVAVLLTVCAVSGTFAKYVTTAEASDTARVAKWGVTIEASGAAFEKAYAFDGTTTTLTGNSVVSSNDDKLVAPGTKHDVAAIKLAGTPEVAVRVSFTGTVALTGWTAWDDAQNKAVEYCPIVFTVNGDTYGTNDTDATNKSASVEALVTAVQNAIAKATAEYAALTDLSTIGVASSGETQNPNPLSISWAWAFETGADAAKAANNIKDTILGNAAAAGNAATIAISVTATVTQID